MKNIFLILISVFLLAACGEECYNAPLPVVFEIVNSNNENLIGNGNLGSFYIEEENKGKIELTKTSDNKIVLENVGAYNGTKNYTFYSAVRVFNFSIESSEFKGGCNGFQINKLSFTGIAIDVTDENGYYKIILQ